MLAYNEKNLFNLAFLLEAHYCFLKQKSQLFYLDNRIIQIVKDQNYLTRIKMIDI